MNYDAYIRDMNSEIDWRRKDAARALEAFQDVDVHRGVARWKSNGQVPPNELLTLWAHYGKPFDLEDTKEARERDLDEHLKQYREARRKHGFTEEEKMEARAAFGPGVVVEDVLTGHRFTT